MASKNKRIEEAKKRDKRSKTALVVLGVLMIAVAAYEIPSMLKVMNKKPPPGSTYDPGPSGVVPGSLPNLATGASTSTTHIATAPTGQLVDTDVPPSSGEGQLVTFEVFQTKNPFVPQVKSAATPVDGSGATDAGGGTSTDPTTSTTTTTTPPTTTPDGVVPGIGGTSTTPTATTPTTTTPTSTTPVVPASPTITLTVNGVTSHVSVDGTFPSSTPVFRLISYKSGSAQIGIVGGSYAAGGAALTLEVGQPVTLQNTTDGKQYKLELLKTP
jgi:hypothetical protein